jgi:hypothetical protein
MTGGSDGNARLTAAAAVVLTVLLALEGLTLLGGVGRYLLAHVFLGLLLIPPVVLKLASTSWRMTSYYRRVEEYVHRGPPHVVLRVLVAPVLVGSTVVLLATGIAAAWTGQRGLLLGLHKLSFIVWGVAFGLHFLAHAANVPRLALADWWRSKPLAGRRLRQGLLVASVAAGLVLAVTAFPLVDRWQDHASAVIGVDPR